VSARIRRSPGAGPGIANLDAGKRNDSPQHATTAGSTVTIESAYAWAAAGQWQSLLIELQADWVALVTGQSA